MLQATTHCVTDKRVTGVSLHGRSQSSEIAKKPIDDRKRSG